MELRTVSIQGEKEIIRHKILKVLKKQGFTFKEGRLLTPTYSKEEMRSLNSLAVRDVFEKNYNLIQKYDELFVNKYIADGVEVEPERISPKIIRIDASNTELVNLFRWVKLHWSIPISAGYGRRLRYVVFDQSNNKLIGIIGLADPVYGLKDREKFIGWDSKTKAKNLKHIMEGFVIGAVQPYSFILGGKLVASLIASDKVAKDFHKKYAGKRALISGKKFSGKLVAVTTSSAFGKSSVYDRISIPNGPNFLHVGWTSGSGEFQFSNGEYHKLFEITKRLGYSGKNKKWGNGIRNRRTVVKKALTNIGFSQDLLYHGIKRELFFIPLARNWKELLLGTQKRFKRIQNRVDYISDFILRRWILPRANRNPTYREYKKEEYSLMFKKQP